MCFVSAFEFVYLFWEYLNGDNIWNRKKSHVTEINNTGEAKWWHPFKSGLIDPQITISSEQEKAGRCDERRPNV